MVKRFLMVVVVLILLCSVGCRIDMDVKVNSDGSGKGKIIADTDVFSSAEDCRQRLVEYGLRVDNIEQTGNQIIANVSWKEFNTVKVFERRTVEGNKVTLEFGMLTCGDVTAQVPGKIISTSGRIDERNKRKVYFRSGDHATVVYQSKTILTTILQIIIILMGLSIIIWTGINAGASKKTKK